MSFAHFQLAYTEQVIIERAGHVPAKLVFWHPMSNGHAMDMLPPQNVSVIHRGKTTDLTSTLVQTTFKGLANEAVSWDVNVPVKRSGDYVLVVTPEPYYEESEDIYIQQIAKSYLNRNQFPTDWQQTQGLKTEIRPLVKPYSVAKGTNFRGQVLSEGKPVAFAEIEVEYMVALPDMANNAVSGDASIELPGGAMTILSDAHGVFSMALPKVGHWGFAALGTGPDGNYKGKELSQDAVIWVQVHDFN
ncbi:MAG TPA: DUF4198 domain-containing protein [Oceanospirillaceae bacterium]|nr:DUF4198 domain-containing protein [Oceanospirillaceae bacterium]